MTALSSLRFAARLGHLNAETKVLSFGRRHVANISAYVEKPWSYAYGRSHRQLQHITIGELLEQRAKDNGNKTALISYHENLTKTFSELSLEANRIARALQNLGVKRGDVIGLWSTNCARWILLQYAVARVGAVLCTLNPVYKLAELEYTLKKANIKVLLMPGPNSPQKVVNSFSDIIHDQNLINQLKAGSDLEHVVYMDDSGSGTLGDSNIKLHSFDDIVRNKSTDALPVIADPSDPCIIMFTSGTTGKPKGAFLSHFTTVNNAILTGEKVGFTSLNEVRICCPLPLFHSFACTLGSIAMLSTSSTLTLTGYKYDVKAIVNSIVKHELTHLIGTPTILIDILNHVEDKNINVTSLKGVMAGGASVPVEVAQRVSKVIKPVDDMRIGYGATELGPCTTASNPEDPYECKMETVGAPIDFVEVKLVNPHTGEIVKLGEQGELLARGHNVMLGYWNEPEKTKESITEANWDMATMDESGYVKIVGRTKEMIIRGGENIYPKEIEEFLHEHDDILDAYVVGVPDDRYGEECCAWVKLRHPDVKLTADQIKEFLKDKISYFKIPKYILFVNDFPLTSTGKAQKFIMREKSNEILGLKELK